MQHLKEQRTVSESGATFDAFCTAYAEILIYSVLVVGVLDKFPLNGACRAKKILRPGTKRYGRRHKIAGAELTIPTESESMHGLYGRLLKDTISGTISTLGALVGVYLPNKVIAPLTCR